LLPNDRSSTSEEEDIIDGEHDEEIDEEMQLNGEEPSNQQSQIVGNDASDANGTSNGE